MSARSETERERNPKQMTNTPHISLILYIDHPEGLQTALASMLRQKRFLSSCQLIAVTPEETEEQRALLDQCGEKTAIPPRLLTVPGCDASKAYNAGLEAAEGEWINFSLASASFSDNVFADIARANRNHNTISLISLRPVWVTPDGETPYLVAPVTDSDISVDLERQYRNLQMVPQAYFFRRDLIGERRFREDLHDDALHLFLLESLGRSADEDSDLKTPTFRFLTDTLYRYTVPLEDNVISCQVQHEKWWYIDSVREFMLPYLRSFAEAGTPIPPYIQYACVWLIGSKYRCNYNDANKHMLDREETALFHQLCCQAMVYLDNHFILQRGFTPPVKLSLASRIALLQGKAEQMGCRLHLTNSGPELTVRFLKKDGSAWDGRPDDDIVGLVNKDRVKLEFRLIEYEDNHLVFHGLLVGSVLLTGEPFELYALTWLRGKDPARHQKIPGEHQDVYCLRKNFGRVTMKDYPVTFRIPMKKGPIQKLRFYLKIAGMEILLQTTYPRVLARLSNFRKSFWQFTNNRVLIPSQEESGPIKELHILKNASRRAKLDREKAYRKAFLSREKGTPEAKNALRLRRLYYLTRPFFRRKSIWVSFDKLYKAGDNGEYMYQYGREHIGTPGMPEFYYIVNKDSPDYPRLKAQKHAKILKQNSVKCFLTCMNAQVILATHSNVHRYFNDNMAAIRCMRNLYKSKVVCIQHGLSINQIAHFQNQWFDDTVLYTCASPFEKANLSGKHYGYQDKQLQLTGLARYDGLKSQEKKLILITPTWRKDVAARYVFGEQRGYNPDFKHSAYFHVYDSLINDPRLLETAERTGYRIMYLLHPATSSQLPDFKDNGHVELVAAAGDMNYEKVLTEASLMVTDYSGVQFDFAYQRKPLVYYHPDTLPPHYEEGGLHYETMGFGPVCKDQETLVDTLCRYMEDGCRMQPEYVQRADAFFSHSDFHNCERIYHAVEDMLAGKLK